MIRDGPHPNRDDEHVVYFLPRRRSIDRRPNSRRGTIHDVEPDTSAVPGLERYEQRQERDDDAQRTKMTLIALAVNALLITIGVLLATNIVRN